MKQKRIAVRVGLVAVALLLACEGSLFLGGFEFLENRSFDLLVRLAPPPQPPPPEIVIVDIDNPSFAALRDAIGRWPWTRLLWVELIRFLKSGGARLVVFDAVFAGQENADVDSEFAQAIAEAGNVVLAFVLVQYEAEQASGVSRPPPAKVPGEVSLRDGVGLPLLSADKFKGDLPLPELAQKARALGSITITPDPDGVIRRLALFYHWRDGYYPSLALAAGMEALHLDKKLQPELTPGEFRWGSVKVPVTRNGNLVPHWRPDPAAYPRLPFWKVTCSIFPEICEEEKRFYSPGDFRDKIVIVGASAAGAFDVFATPVAPVTPGFLVHTAVLESLLTQNAVTLPPSYATHLLMVLLASLALAAVWSFRSAMRSTLTVAMVLGLYLLLATVAFGVWNLWLPVAAPVTSLLVSFVGQSITRYVTTGRDLRQARQTLNRYVSPKVVEYIMAHGGPDRLRGVRQEITVMFSDVRNFTTFSEKRAPAEVMAVLNRYLDAMTEIVFAHNGVVDKFIGDGMLCYWGAFGDGQEHANQAVEASEEMMVKLQELNYNWRAEGLPEINIGIGINTGEAVFGNLGAGKKVEFTVLGDTVNVASRLESMNKELGTRVIMSGATRAKLGAGVRVRFLEEAAIRGRSQTMKIYELVSDPSPEDSDEFPSTTTPPR